MKYLVIALLCTTISFAGYTQKVSEQQAAVAGKNFYFEKLNQKRPNNYNDIIIDNIEAKKTNGNVLYYIIKFKNIGFVIVAGNINITPVLCYSFSSRFFENEQPPAFVHWMQDYEKQIAAAFENNYFGTQQCLDEWTRLLNSTPEQLKKSKGTKSVEPLLHTTWNQDKYYNSYCPEGLGGPGGHAYAGCVPTAMAQIMNYYRHPEQGVGAYTYTHPDYGTLSADFENTTYQWDLMPLAVNEHHNDSSIAKLLYHLGVSVDLDYGPDGSGMFNHKAAYSLRTYFKYSPACEYVFRDTAINTDWKQLILSHLDEKKPLYYAGWADTINVSGHAFVCDGYQDTDYFHFNWGWGGSLNGYFLIDNLTPGGSDFTLDHELIINFFPDTSLGYPTQCNGTTTLTQTKGTFGDGSGPLLNYNNSSDCYWLIEPNDSITNIKLNFLEFNTEQDSDIVIVYGGATTNAPVIGTYSGSSLPSQITSTSKALLVHFISNDSINFSGWLASYTCTVPIFCSVAIQELTEVADTFEDGSGPYNYHYNQLCRWRIQPPGATSINLHFDFFDLAPTDYIRVIDNANTIDLDTIYGTDTPTDIVCNSGSMLIIFKTFEKETAQGFTASYYLSNSIDEPDLLNTDIAINPNPTSNQLFINFSRVAEQSTYHASLFSYDGKLIKVFNINVPQGSLSYELDISMLNKGIYLLKLLSNKENFVKKLIIK
ncbi:MAG: C10 family peptidase [Bacteroidales bacterium]|jgi:hypothetical protein|nr:C10 family peptidase [Bacteroidales bacterium]MDD4215604.1 C10 family peptidase [Bacteroidales bacterium]